MKLKFILLLYIILLGCGSKDARLTNTIVTEQKAASKKQKNCSNYIPNDTLCQKLFDLNYSVFDTNIIKQLFNKPFVTIIKTIGETGNSFIYNYKSGSSEVYFSCNNYYQEFYLDYAKIMDNSIKMNYNITIGMKKEIFFKNINQTMPDCDSINIHDDSSSNLYLFDNNKLSEVIFSTGI